MTVWKAIKPEADAAAQIAVALAKGDDVPSDLINQQVDNGQKEVPSVILTPVGIIKSQRQQRRRGRRREGLGPLQGHVQERMRRRRESNN